jgi:hypothetical protein
MDEILSFGEPEHLFFIALLAMARAADFFSTWLATPNLKLEANPLARYLGWRWAIVLNLVVCVLLGVWPFPAVVVATTSVLVAARNLRQAWLVRTLGEDAYRLWLGDRLKESRMGLFLFCLIAEAALVGAIGAVLVSFGRLHLTPVGIGTGMIVYGIAVVSFTLIGIRGLLRS